jgi:hypothetical protein
VGAVVVVDGMSWEKQKLWEKKHGEKENVSPATKSEHILLHSV